MGGARRRRRLVGPDLLLFLLKRGQKLLELFNFRLLKVYVPYETCSKPPII